MIEDARPALVSSDANYPATVEQPAADPHRSGNVFQVLHGLLRGRYHWAILLGGLGAALGGVLGYTLVPLVYQSTGMIQVIPSLPRILYTTEENNPMPMFDAFVKSQVTLLQSRRVADLAMQSDAWRDLRRPVDSEAVQQFMAGVQVNSGAGQREVFVIFTDRDPQAATVATKAVIDAYLKVYAEQDPANDAQRLRKLEERRMDLTNQVKSLRASVVAIANEFGSDQLERIYDFRLQEAERFEEALKETQAALAAADATAGPGPGGKSLAQYSIDEIAAIDPRMRQYLIDKENLQRHAERLLVRFGEQHREVQQVRATISSVEEQMQTLANRYRSLAWTGGPTTQPATQPTTAPADRSVGAVARAGVGGGGAGDPGPAFATELERMRVKEQNLRRLFTEAKSETIDVGQKKLKIEGLRAEIETIQEMLKQTNTRLDQLSVESTVGGRVHLVSSGDVPLGPSNKKKRTQATMMGALGLGGVGVGLILLVGLRDRRLKTIDQARSSLVGVRMLGILPHLPEDLSDPQHAAIAAHCVHQIRTLMQIGPPGERRQVFAITSPGAATGKTSLTLALGLSFAACGVRTLMIDCDLVGRGLTAGVAAIVRRRLGQVLKRQGLVTEEQLQKALELARLSDRKLGTVLVELGCVNAAQVAEALVAQDRSTLGILDACDGEVFDACLAPAGVERLFTLPAGAAAGREAGSLSPALIHRLVERARQRFEVVLIDTGPVPGSLEGSMAAAAADGVLLVVSAGDQRPLAEAAVEHLRSVGARITGLVFNRADADDMAHSSLLSTSQERASRAESGSAARPAPAEAEVANRFGPVASAVATYTASVTARAPAPAGDGPAEAVAGGTLEPGFAEQAAAPTEPIVAADPVEGLRALRDEHAHSENQQPPPAPDA